MTHDNDEIRYVGSQGEEIIGRGSVGLDFVKNYANYQSQYARMEKEWIEMLRRNGIKAAHPDDGWVDRSENSIHFSYPQFNDNPQVGDLIMLGWPNDPKRIVRVVMILPYLSFIIDNNVKYMFSETNLEIRDGKLVERTPPMDGRPRIIEWLLKLLERVL